MKHVIIITAEELDDKNVVTEISIKGDQTILAKAAAGLLQTSPQFRDIILESIANLMAGVSIQARKLQKKVEPKPSN